MNMIKLKKTILLGLVASLGMGACQQKNETTINGVWKGILQNDATIDLPFTFELYDSVGSTQVAFLNGEERLNISEVRITADSIIIKTPLYDTEIRAQLGDKEMSGTWIKHLPTGDQRMPFSAKYGATEGYRDPVKKTETPKNRLAGRWSVQILREGAVDTTFSVGEFKQAGNTISGTFLTNFGDYRYLGGAIDRDDFFLSTYSGSGATLFTGHFADSNTIINGKIYSGPTSVADWTAKRDSSAMLPDAYSLTKLKSGETTLNFKFPDTEGNVVSTSDERFKDKVVVIQFLGSWCPNCMDETAFLSPFYEKYKSQGVEIIGLAYERYPEPEKAKKAVTNLMNRFKVSYPVLLTGFSNKNAEVLKSLPQLENFNAFPTTIIINKQGEVSSIHTGFDGPATGQAYLDYITAFEAKINSLLGQ